MAVASSATADSSTPRGAGVQSAPPGPDALTPPPLVANDGQRRAIRGCPAPGQCRVDIRGLREFERETFPRAGSRSPWVEGDDRYGHRIGSRRGRSPRGTRGGAANPLTLRPDLPWLAKLELPDLPFRWNEKLISYLEFYKDDPRGRQIMAGWLRAQGAYKDMILEQLQQARLPDDLLYVAMIESSYDPHEYSRVGASGLWQFMPAGGSIYGLEMNRWLDERNDPERSTAAAVQYWLDLYERFGDWALAMAAYNCGYGAVLNSIAKYNTNDFWLLSEYENGLPWGASLYVPKAVAAAIVGHNRKFFGFDDVNVAEPIRTDHVSVPKSVSLAVVARAAGVSEHAIEALNPQLRKHRTPPGIADYVLRIPRGTRGMFAERFPQLSGDWQAYDAYVVAHGQRFEDVATMFGISLRELRELNGIEHESEVRGGTVLVVPRVSAEERNANLEVAEESLYAAGEPEGGLGEPLVVAVPDREFDVPGKRRVFYRVVTGDTQYGIAHAFGVERAALAEWNGLDPTAYLHPRMVMQVFVDEDFDASARTIKLLDPRRILVVTRGSQEHIDVSEQRMGRRRVVYKASGRESYESIGKRYGLTSRDLARINNEPHDTVLDAGQECIVYEVVDRSRSDRAAAQGKKARARR